MPMSLIHNMYLILLYSCGACPAGYEKVSGELCIWVGQCHTDNGGCSPNAVCNDNPG